MALIARRFKRFMKKKKQNFKRRPFKEKLSKDREKEKDKEVPIYFECNKSDHFKMGFFFSRNLARKLRKR